MGTLPSLLVRSCCFVAAALVLTAPARAQIPVAAPDSEPAAGDQAPATGTDDQAPATGTGDQAPATGTGDQAPATGTGDLAPATGTGDQAPATGDRAPPTEDAPKTGTEGKAARADRLKERVTPGEEAEEYFEDDVSGTEGPRRKWYGWQTLVADGISTTVFFAAFNDDDAGGDDTNEALAWAGILGYEFAPAIVHFVHRKPGRGFASMGIRLGMPLAGAFLGGAAASGCHETDCKAAGAGIGFLLGMGGAIAIDAALLAFDYPESTARSAMAERLLPVLSLSPQHAFVGVRGSL